MNKNNLKLYWKIVQFNFAKFYMHPTEFIATLVGRSVSTWMLLVLWYTISLTNPSINFKLMLSYFLILNGFKNLMYTNDLRLGKYIGDIIKDGTISNYLIKPIKIIPYLTFSFTGDNWIVYIYSFILIIIGLAFYPVVNLINYFWCLVFLMIGMVIAININVLVSTMNFYNPEASGIRLGIQHSLLVLTGSFVPLTLMPIFVKNILLWTPFPFTAFIPTYILQTALPTPIILHYLLVGLFWSSVLTIITNKVWIKSTKQYESVGI